MRLQKTPGKKIINLQIDTVILTAAKEYCSENGTTIQNFIQKTFKKILLEKLQKELN